MRSPPKHQKRATKTFEDIRWAAEKRLARGLKLDFDQIMLDIAAVRRGAGKPVKN